MVLGITRQTLIDYAPDRPNLRYSISAGEQQQVNPYSEQGIRGSAFLAATGVIAGGFFAAKHFGVNPWDPIYQGIRTAEEFSPGKILRTFQLGNFLSQFTTEGRAPLNIPASAILPNSEFFRDLLFRSEVQGGLPTALRATSTGLQFREGTLYAGDDVVLRNATKMISTGNPYLAAEYSRAQGFTGLPNSSKPNALRMELPLVVGEDGLTQSVYFTGSKTRAGAVGKQIHALLGEWTVERANRLADAPFGIEPFTTGLERARKFWEGTFGTRFTLAVESGTPLQTLGRMGVKWGGIGTAAYLGYQTADWAVRNTGALDGTIFDQGLTAGIASIGIKANLLASNIADVIPGVRSYREAQEELAPGSTSLMKLAAFPLTGVVAGGTAYYLSGVTGRAKAIKELMGKGLTYTQALPLAEQHWLSQSTSIIQENPLTRALEKRFGEKIPFIGKITRGKGFALAGAALFTLPILPFLPGALIPEKTEEELEAIYSGRQEVEVRKGRFWELGRSPYEGGKIEYFRPHWYARMNQRAYDASMYGGEDPNPILQWLKENFTYDMEREHYRDRPYPVTGTAFEDVPILGPLLGATVGRLIKPPQLMHTQEWMGSNSLDSNSPVLRTPGRLGEGPPEQPGDLSKGTPIDPGSIRQVAGEQAYRLTELSGLTGFTFSTLKEMITGSDEFFDQEEILQSARRAYGAERAFWDLNMGGAAFTNELLRRMYPHRRRQIQEYNPIRNTMPSWLPGPGDRSPDFLHGDPFIKVQEGELRLPGEGYATRFPELSGVNPEDYPLIHRYKILADIAPYSDKTRALASQLGRMASGGQLTPEELALLQETKRQTAAKKETKQFYEFEALGEAPDITLPGGLGATQSRSVVAALNNILAVKSEQKQTVGKSIIGGYWESLAMGLQNPFEALIPIAPGSKLLNMKSAIQDYKQTQIFGPDIAFWEHPIENFILPFFREVGGAAGFSGVPEEVQHRRGIEEYFDTLKYIKNKRLAEAARVSGAGEVAGAYERAATETTIGINPYTRDYSALFRALPRSERDYFGEFVGAKTAADRAEILSLVPTNLRRIYAAQWEQQYASVIQQALDNQSLSGDIASQAQSELDAFWNKRETEGFPIDSELQSRYFREREGEEDYGDWFRRSVLIPETIGGEGIPGPDWVGWHPGVDLEEVKLKVVKNEGLDIHDFNLWPSDELSAIRKPYLDDISEDLVSTIIQNEGRSVPEVQAEVRKLLGELGIGSNAQIIVYEVPDDKEEVKIEINSSEIRSPEIRRLLNERINEIG